MGAVYFQKVFITAENITNCFQRLFLFMEELLDEGLAVKAPGKAEIAYQVMKLNNIGSFVHSFQKS